MTQHESDALGAFILLIAGVIVFCGAVYVLAHFIVKFW